MNAEVRYTVFESLKILGADLGLRHSAVVFKGAAGRDQNDSRGLQTGAAALYIEEFFRSEIRAEARLGDAVVRELQSQLCCADAVAAVRDIGKGTSVHNRRRTLQSLNQIRLYRVLEKRRHCAVSLQIPGVNRLAVIIIGD